MASYGHQTAPRPGQRHGGHVAVAATAAAPAPAIHGTAAPPGTFSPGTKIQVGSHRVVIQKYLSEGGFAHVYLVKLSKPVDGTDLAVLKRVAVPDKEALRSMRTEVETMKRLKGHRPIVTYIDSHASELRGGGYEVFLLMEYCNGGGLIDFMNTRLQHRLTEPEILDIFADITEGVACMHYLKPPLLHRDLKVENVLITVRGSAKRFKLCDFGSAAPPRPAPTNVVECRLMDEDVQRHTTLQYRSPEMVDVYRKQPLNEQSDIWALGVLLYKLCYYTTPFEDQGQLAILNASYRFPSYPVFSDRIKKLIASMLRESMDARPTIYQVLKEACSMQGRDVPIQDIYAARRKTDSQANGKPLAERKAAPQAVGAVFEPPVQETQSIPNVVPMRRGRPTASPGPSKNSHQPDSSPVKVAEGDPFAALDSKAALTVETDELASRFPTLDQFSLLHDKGGKFSFDAVKASPPLQAPHDESQGTTEKLANAAFASPRTSPANLSPSAGLHSVASSVPDQAIVTSPPLSRPPSTSLHAQPKPELSKAQAIISSNPDLKAISSSQGTSKYVSTGTMTTTDIPSEPPARQANQSAGNRASSYQSRPSHLRQSSLSRLSREDGRPQGPVADATALADSWNIRPRPASTTFESSTLEFLREREFMKAQSRVMRPLSRDSKHKSSPSLNSNASRDDGTKAARNPGPLTDTDDADSDSRERLGSTKRSSITSASGARNKLAGKFSDAFKRFESPVPPEVPSGGRPSSLVRDTSRRDLTPIAGSEAADGRSDDGLVMDSDDSDATPEMRREVERRKLEEEEQRVAAAQAEYKKRVAGGGANPRPAPGPKKMGGASRAASIQSRVQSLLDEEQRPPQVRRTAEGYGKYSDAARAASRSDKPLHAAPSRTTAVPNPKVDAAARRGGPTTACQGPSAPPAMASKPTGSSRPAAPRKPVHLNGNPTGARQPSPAKSGQPPEHLMAAELPGQPVLEMSAQERDDYIKDFSKRFPSLSSMEMEAMMGRGRGGAVER